MPLPQHLLNLSPALSSAGGVNVLQYPDAEGAIRAWARAHAVLRTKFGNPARIYFGAPDGDPILPLLTLSRVGGAPVDGDYPVDLPLIGFHVWGNSKAQAADAAMALVNAINGLRDSTLAGTDAVLCDGTVTLLVWSPDPDNDRPRYLVDAVFAIRKQGIAA
jgi:hypothetical protein